MGIIAVANAKGGVGKTTTVVNLVPVLPNVKVVELDTHLGVTDINRLRDESLPLIDKPKDDAELIKLLESDTPDGILLFDCGGYDDDLTRLAIANADMVIIPSNDDALEEFAMIKFQGLLDELSERNGRDLVGHVLLNRVYHSRTNFDAFDGMIAHLPRIERLDVEIPHTQRIPKAMGDGQHVASGTVPVKYARTAKLIIQYLKEKGALNHE